MLNKLSRLKPHGIAGRIALSIATAVVLIAIILVITLRVEFEARLKVDAQRHLESILARESEAMNQELLRVKRLSLALRQLTVNTISLDSLDTQATIDQYENQIIPQAKDLIKIFDNVSGWILFNSELLPGANTISYTYEQGTFIREPEYDAVADGYSKEPWWAEAVKRGEHWTKPYYWAPWDADIITYSVPVIVHDKLVAVAGAEFFIKPFQERLRKIKVYDTGFVMLIDTEGDAIYLPKEAEANELEKWYQEKRKVLLSEPSGVDYIGSGSLIDQKIIAWYRLDNGWLLIAQPQAKEMFSSIVRTYEILTLLLLLTVPIALLLGAVLARSLTKRLKALIHVAEHFQDNLQPNQLQSQNIMLLPETGNDDISMLNITFNRLQQDIQNNLSALSISEAKYRTLVEYSDNLIFTISTNGHFLTTNRAMENIVGRPKESLQGMHFTTIFEAETTKQFWQDKFELACQSKQRIQTETKLTTPDGKERVLSVTLLPILTYPQSTSEQVYLNAHTQTPHVEMIMGTASDLTERLNVEREIQRLLERDKAALSRLVSGIAHEMNTPIGNVMVLLSYLEGTLVAEGETREVLQSMRRSLQRAIDLINHFKELSASQQKGPMLEANLKTLLKVSISSLDMQEHVRLNCDDHLTIHTYPSTLMQVIHALVDNAITHGPALQTTLEEDKFNITVSASLDASKRQVMLIIHDNGIGITPAVLEHIFDPFYTTKGGQNHSGLGLTVAYNAVSQVLSGEIKVHTIPYPAKNHGTTFTIRLPYLVK